MPMPEFSEKYDPDKPWLERVEDQVDRVQRVFEALNEELRSSREDNARLRSQLERSLGEERLATATRRTATTIAPVGDMSPTRTP